MIRFLLGFVSLFRPIYRSMGVDFEQLRAIVGVKLTMDNRRNSSAFPQRQKVKESNYKFLISIALYSLFGCFVAMLIYTMPSLLVSLTIYFAFLMVTIVMTLVSDFSSVLLDTSDNTIILPRPVSGQTMVAARTTHILLYLGQIMLGLMVVPLIVVAIKFGVLFTLLFVIVTVMAVLFAVIFTNGFYLVLMQFTSEEKLKSIINYFQIGITIVVMGSYQILPRMMGETLMVKEFAFSWWATLIPPMWMAGALHLYHTGDFSLIYILASLFAIVIPIGGFYLTNKYLAPKFAEKLADLGTNSTSGEAADVIQVEKKKVFSLSTFITQPGLERGTFDMVSRIFSRDRKLKLKIYPSIGTLFIMFFVILMQGKHKMNFSLESMREGSLYIYLLYAPFFVVQTAMMEVAYTDDFKAAWIFTSSPITKPGLILSGSWKAVFVRFFLPAFALTSIFAIVVWHEMVLDDIVFAFANNLFLFLVSSSILKKTLPASMDPSARAATGFVRNMMVIVILGAVGFGHYLLIHANYLIWIGTPFVFAGAYFMLKSFQNTPWSEIET